jgi:hypothetical protein
MKEKLQRQAASFPHVPQELVQAGCPLPQAKPGNYTLIHIPRGQESRYQANPPQHMEINSLMNVHYLYFYIIIIIIIIIIVVVMSRKL